MAPSRSLVLLLAVAATGLALMGGVVAAAWSTGTDIPEPAGMGANGGLIARLKTPAVRGLVIVDIVNEDDGQVSTSLMGLSAGRDYRLVISSDGCGTPGSSAERLFAYRFTASAKGTHFRLDRAATDSVGEWRVESIRVSRVGGSQIACAGTQQVVPLS